MTIQISLHLGRNEIPASGEHYFVFLDTNKKAPFPGRAELYRVLVVSKMDGRDCGGVAGSKTECNAFVEGFIIGVLRAKS